MVAPQAQGRLDAAVLRAVGVIRNPQGKWARPSGNGLSEFDINRTVRAYEELCPRSVANANN